MVKLSEFNYYYIFYCFIAYSFLGWCLEVLYHIYEQHRFVNRGFLYGPLCPVYGVTAVSMIAFLTPLQENIAYMFIGGFILASVIEFITGYLLEVFFKTRWWDYSHIRFNLYGYICLRFSVIWGILAVAFMKVINPPISAIIHGIPSQLAEVGYSLLVVVLAVDITMTINNLIRFKQLFTELQNISQEILSNIEKIREQGVAKTLVVSLEKRNAKLKYVYERLSSRFSLKHISLLRAYPKITSRKFGTVLEEVKEKLASSKRLKKVLEKFPRDK